MALWPFGKKKDADETAAPADETIDAAQAADAHGLTSNEGASYDDDIAEGATLAEGADAAADAGVHAVAHDPVNGTSGPFDGDQVDIETFDFTDFSVGIIDLGSMKIPLPKNSGVTIDVDDNGPQRIRIVTEHGSIIPVAFAAPRTSGQWADNAQESYRGIVGDGIPARYEDGPWGTEVVAQRPDGVIRIIGIEGPRWMLRLTTAAPAGSEDAMAQLGREVAARTFVYRGDQPILAGTSLPVSVPQQLVPMLQERMEQMQKERAAAAQAAAAAEAAGPTPPSTEAERAAADQMSDLHKNAKNDES